MIDFFTILNESFILYLQNKSLLICIIENKILSKPELSKLE